MSQSTSIFGVIRSPTQYLKFQPTHSETAFSLSACLYPYSAFPTFLVEEPARHNRLYYALFRFPFRRLAEASIAKSSRKSFSQNYAVEDLLPFFPLYRCSGAPKKIDSSELYATMKNIMISFFLFLCFNSIVDLVTFDRRCW